MRAKWLIGVCVTLGLTLSLACTTAVWRWEEDLADQHFASVARTHHLVLQNGWNEYVAKLVALQAMFQSADAVSREEFEIFTGMLLKEDNAIQNLSWVPRIFDSERATFEAAARAEGISDFRIKNVQAKRQFMTSPQRDEYLPIFYTTLPRTTPVLGIDLAAQPVIRAPLERARDTDTLSCVPQFVLNSVAGGRQGILFSLPVYRRGNVADTVNSRRQNHTGFVHGAFIIDEMIATSIRNSIPPQDADIYLFSAEAAPADGPISVYRSSHRTQTAAPLSLQQAAAGTFWTATIGAGAARWRLIVRPTPDGALVARHDRAWLVLIAGLLLTALAVAYLLAQDRHARRLTAINRRVSHMARSDGLTGLANRRAFIEQIEDALHCLPPGGSQVAVLCFDLDHFKDVNDTFGHPTGDELLQEVAKRVRSLVRTSDVVARLGGDEFAILQSAVGNREAAAVLAGKINQAIATPFIIDGNDIHVSASVGIALSDGAALDPAALMVRADLALYRAKAEGRSCFRFHSEELDVQVRERVSIADELRLALQNGELELFYQPQVEVSSGRIVGAEALLRWNHPTRGLIAPGAFISVAERSGIILPLGQWTFDAACRQMRAWQDAGIAPPSLAVNCSAVQFKNGADLRGEVAASLARWSIPRQCMEIELTESVLMELTGQHTTVLDDLRALGVMIAIDDFGTGYSSLNYLTLYSVSRLKIAQELVLRAPYDDRSAIVVKAAIRLAAELGIDLVAEGVEKAEHRAFLMAAECTNAQGYYFSRPVTAAAMTALLQAGRISPSTPRLVSGQAA